MNVKIRWPLLENHRLEFLLSSYKTFRKHLSLIRKNLHQVAKRASGDQEGAAWRVPVAKRAPVDQEGADSEWAPND